MDLQEYRLGISAIQTPARLAQPLRGSGRRTHREGVSPSSKTASLNKQVNTVQCMTNFFAALERNDDSCPCVAAKDSEVSVTNEDVRATTLISTSNGLTLSPYC